jgi:hypothetical protein
VYPFPGLKNAALATTCGYVLRCLTEQEFCSKCTDKLETLNENTRQKSRVFGLIVEMGNKNYKNILVTYQFTFTPQIVPV